MSGYADKRDRIITGSSDSTVRIWASATGRCIRVLRGHCAAVTHLEVDSTGKTLFSASSDGKIISWRIDTGDHLMAMEEHKAPISCLTVTCIAQFTRPSSLEEDLSIIPFSIHYCLFTSKTKSRILTSPGMTGVYDSHDGREARIKRLIPGIDEKLSLQVSSPDH
ncbi:hypothetical protein Ciccas_004578 [Cichlidogyrus casuarinus]|uniref:Uncharacterized protein n=1 Tax=Cichlidogyrus casuarinus TaxID=1844966 RepID=A0ABD2QB39_9PLAT